MNYQLRTHSQSHGYRSSTPDMLSSGKQHRNKGEFFCGPGDTVSTSDDVSEHSSQYSNQGASNNYNCKYQVENVYRNTRIDDKSGVDDSSFYDEESTVYTDYSTLAASTIAEGQEAGEIALWLSKLSLGKNKSLGKKETEPHYQPVLSTVKDLDEEDDDDDSEDDSSVASEEVRKEIGFWMGRLGGLPSAAKPAPVEDSDVSYSDDSESSEEEDFFRQDFTKPSTTWTAQTLLQAQPQSIQHDFTKPTTTWTPETLPTQTNFTKPTSTWTVGITPFGEKKKDYPPESPTAPESTSDTNVTEKKSHQDPDEYSEEDSTTDSSDDSCSSSSDSEDDDEDNEVQVNAFTSSLKVKERQTTSFAIKTPIPVPQQIVQDRVVQKEVAIVNSYKEFNVSQSTTTDYSEDSEDESDDDDSQESIDEPKKEVIAPAKFKTSMSQETRFRTPPAAFYPQEAPKASSQKPPRPPQPEMAPDDAERAQMMLQSKFAMFNNLKNESQPSQNKMQLPSPLTSPSTNEEEGQMSGELSNSATTFSSGEDDDDSYSDDSSGSSDVSSDSGDRDDDDDNDDKIVTRLPKSDVPQVLIRSSEPVPSQVVDEVTIPAQEEEQVNYPDMSQHFEFIQDAELKRMSAKLHKRLNIDPWDDTNQLKDDYVHDFIQEHPETCRVQYFYNHFNERLFPLSMLCALGASVETIKVAYDAFKFAADQCDLWVGSPLHYACAYKASLDVVQFLVERKPAMMIKVNDLQRTPLHLACLFKTSMATISLLINTFPQVLTMKDRNGCTPLHLAAENGASTGVVSALIRANKSTCMARTKSNMTPLHLACAGAAPRSVIKTLMDAEPQSITSVDEMGRSPLHVAAQYGAPLSTIQMLVKASPDMVDEETHRGETPLQLAKKHQAPANVIKFLS